MHAHSGLKSRLKKYISKTMQQYGAAICRQIAANGITHRNLFPASSPLVRPHHLTYNFATDPTVMERNMDFGDGLAQPSRHEK
jgi:hypothetical protein